MQKELVISLKQKAEHIANIYSNIERDHNGNQEQFKIIGIQPTSKTTAIVTFQKTTGKLAIAFLYYINMKGGFWEYLFPTESHIFGMQTLKPALAKVERFNFKLNGC